MRLPALAMAALLLGTMLMDVTQARQTTPPRPALASEAPPAPEDPAAPSDTDNSDGHLGAYYLSPYPMYDTPPYPATYDENPRYLCGGVFCHDPPAPDGGAGWPPYPSADGSWWDSVGDDAGDAVDAVGDSGHFPNSIAYYTSDPFDSASGAAVDFVSSHKGTLRTTPSGRVTKGTPAAKKAAAAALKRQKKAAAKKKKAAAKRRAAEKACTAKCPAPAGKRAVCGKDGKAYATACGAKCHRTKVASVCKGPAKSCRCRKA